MISILLLCGCPLWVPALSLSVWYIAKWKTANYLFLTTIYMKKKKETAGHLSTASCSHDHCGWRSRTQVVREPGEWRPGPPSGAGNRGQQGRALPGPRLSCWKSGRPSPDSVSERTSREQDNMGFQIPRSSGKADTVSVGLAWELMLMLLLRLVCVCVCTAVRACVCVSKISIN